MVVVMFDWLGKLLFILFFICIVVIMGGMLCLVDLLMVIMLFNFIFILCVNKFVCIFVFCIVVISVCW